MKRSPVEDHKELLRPVEPLPEPSRLLLLLRKIFIRGVALLLLLLILIYFVPGYDFLSILEGKTASNTIQNSLITLHDGTTITFAPEVLAQLQKLYLANQDHEFSACLLGTLSGRQYSITHFVLPQVYDQDVFHVRADLCAKETLIALHSHPYKHCIFSEADIDYYKAFTQQNPKGIIGVMCELERFGFYP